MQGLFSEEIRIEFCTEEDLFLYWTEYTDIYEKSMEFAIYSCTEMKFTIRNSYNMELVEDDESPLYLMGQDAAVCFYDTCAIYFSFHTGEAKLVHNLPAPVQSAHWKDGRELDFRVVMENGSCGTLNINSLEFRNEYGDSWTSGIDLNYALSGGVLEGEFVFGIPDDDSSSVVILRKTMDKNYTVPISDENGEYLLTIHIAGIGYIRSRQEILSLQRICMAMCCGFWMLPHLYQNHRQKYGGIR